MNKTEVKSVNIANEAEKKKGAAKTVPIAKIEKSAPTPVAAKPNAPVAAKTIAPVAAKTIAPVAAKPIAPVAAKAKAASAAKTIAPVAAKAKAASAAAKSSVSKKSDIKKKILFVTSEAAPFLRSGGLGDVAGALPATLCKLGTDTRVIMPLYYDIPEEVRRTFKYVGSVYVTLSWRYQYCGLFESEHNGVKYYFVDNEQYFMRGGLYGHYDDAERFAFFSRAALECLRLIDFYPDVIHSNDWHSGLVSVFLDSFYRDKENYKNIKTVFTIHNIEFQGKYGNELMSDILGLPEKKMDLVNYAGCINFMKGAIESANAVTTVSPSYAKEIMSPYYAYGLESILKARMDKLSGIVNGIDVDIYNPAKDTFIAKNFDIKTIENKSANKESLLNMLGMEYHKSTPLIGMVSRLTEQKGLDLLLSRLNNIMQTNVQMIILGKGDWKYENKLIEMANRYPEKLKVIINFSTDIANKIYAGSDMFLMPSKFEPCGLSQMISMRYGTIPIVRRTGGLNDTVTGFDPENLTGDGFTFYSYNSDDMLDAIMRAIGTYHCKREWDVIVKNAMNKDFSWEESAKQYLDLYNKL